MYSICHNLYFQKLNNLKVVYHKLKDVEQFILLASDIIQEESNRKTEMPRIIHTQFLTLPDSCHKLLRLFNRKIYSWEIAETISFYSENCARRWDYLCKQDLKKHIADDPRIFKF